MCDIVQCLNSVSCAGVQLPKFGQNNLQSQEKIVYLRIYNIRFTFTNSYNLSLSCYQWDHINLAYSLY